MASLSEMGIWVGLDPAVKHGHLVVPIEWQHSTQSWLLHGVVTATTVKVFEDVFPLRKAPPPGSVGTIKFDEYIDSVVNPLYGKEGAGVEPVIGEKPRKGNPKRLAPQYRNPSKSKAL
jgi:hypothetical protein